MPARKETQEFVRKELPYKILSTIYENSRISLKQLGRELNISYHTISKTLQSCERKYKIEYTLELDGIALGFAESRIITVKFENVPKTDELKERFEKDVFIQNAYLATGDFDLLLFVVGLTPADFSQWQYNFRVHFSSYRPFLKISTVNAYDFGFFPFRNEIINKSEVLTDTEKKVLTLLNRNSRMKLMELVKECKITQARIIYIIKKLKDKGIIKRFSALTQRPHKRIFCAYGTYLFLSKEHSQRLYDFCKELVKENKKGASSDYSIFTVTIGAYDNFFVCTFDNGEMLSKRGPSLDNEKFSSENPKTDKAILTDVIVGKWPFHLDKYLAIHDYLKRHENK